MVVKWYVIAGLFYEGAHTGAPLQMRSAYHIKIGISYLASSIKIWIEQERIEIHSCNDVIRLATLGGLAFQGAVIRNKQPLTIEDNPFYVGFNQYVEFGAVERQPADFSDSKLLGLIIQIEAGF